jgi:hypothetical protein
MTAAFVPLVPGSLRTAESFGASRLKPISGAAASTFQPGAPATLKTEKPSAAATHTDHGEPKITLERQGDTITHIRVQCACGQVIELKCQY